MTPKEYLKDKDIKQFALECGVHIATVYRWMNGEATPTNMQGIYKATGGKVSTNDFYGIKL